MELNIIFNGGALRRKAVRCIQGEPVAYETLDIQKKNGGVIMSKKVCITFSVILFIILAALMYCEATHPAGGPAMLKEMMK